MRDSIMHDGSLLPSFGWLRTIAFAFLIVAGSLCVLSFVDDEMGDTSCGGG